MGTGSIPKLLAQLAIPAVIAQIINLLYNIVDRIYIGHIPEVGASALTGVGLFMPILLLINAFAMLAGSGGAPRAAIIGAVINIILNPIFIFVFDMGVKGAALATVLSQAVGALWILRFLSGKKTILKLKKENLKLEKKIILPCLGLGISVFVMMSTESLLSISFTSSLSRYGGDLFTGISAGLPAKLYGSGTSQSQSVSGLSEKDYSANSADLPAATVF